jgi:catechol 2,3-dioxygenase-like lactoylglutathione lyase family enzyme
MESLVDRLSAVLLVSKEAKRLAGFYRDVLGISFHEESHPDAPGLHYGCTLGGVHFAIHPPENFAHSPETGPGGVRIAFRTGDIQRAADALTEHRVPRLFGPDDLGWCHMLSFRDPDGNVVEIVQMRASS